MSYYDDEDNERLLTIKYRISAKADQENFIILHLFIHSHNMHTVCMQQKKKTFHTLGAR